MATLLDFGLTGIFSQIFSMLLVFVLIFAILEKFKIVSDKTGLNALIAISIAFLFLVVPGVSQVIATAAPWFVVMIFLMFVIIMMVMFMGAKEVDIKSALGEQGVVWWIVIISILILVAAVGQVYRSQIQEIDVAIEKGEATESKSFITAVGIVLFNPKVLGMLLLFMIAAITVGRLAAYVK